MHFHTKLFNTRSSPNSQGEQNEMGTLNPKLETNLDLIKLKFIANKSGLY